ALSLKDWRWLRSLQVGWGSAIFLCITAPWFVLVADRNPGFAQFFFVHEHFQRYLTTVHHREGAWWYYVPFLLVGMLPWTSALPWLFSPDASARAMTRASRLLIVWAVFVFL